ncbi:MAG: hypothetical protein ACKVP0_10885 [Pirellulaceae bacterium]
MSTPLVETEKPPTVDADLQGIVDLIVSGKKDPALVQRIRDAADAARREMLEKYGVRDIAVELIHQARERA